MDCDLKQCIRKVVQREQQNEYEIVSGIWSAARDKL